MPGASTERMRQEAVRDQVMAFVAPVRELAKREYISAGSIGPLAERKISETRGDNLSLVADKLLSQGQSALIDAGDWEKDEARHIPIATVYGEKIVDDLLSALGNHDLPTDLKHGPHVTSRKAYPSNLEGIVVIDTNYDDWRSYRRADIVVVNQVYLESQKL